ncbi:MAG: hypothetical protein ACM3U0_01250 [archaeon]
MKIKFYTYINPIHFEGSRFFDKKKLNKYILKTSVDLEVHHLRLKTLQKITHS